MKKDIKTFLALVMYASHLSAALTFNTVVVSFSHSKTIAKLRNDETILSMEPKTAKMSLVDIKKVIVKSCNGFYKIQTQNDTICCTPEHLFYDATKNVWIRAKDITTATQFLDVDLRIVPCIHIEKIDFEEPIECYDLTLAYPHTFFVSADKILTHNFIPLAIGISLAFGEGIAITGAGIGIGTLGLGLWKHFKDKKEIKFAQIEQEINNSNSGGSPDPNNDDDDNNESLKERKKQAEKLAKEMGFKEVKDHKFYSHGEKVFRKGNCDISLDRYSHKGGFWKVFKRGTTMRIGTYNYNLTIKIGG